MIRRFKGWPVIALVALFGLAACARNIGLAPSDLGGDQAGQAVAPSFSQFSDIPIPAGAVMNLDRSLVFGGREAWIGRLVLTTASNAGDMFDFFKQRTAQFGWEEITTVRSAVSILTFIRGERVLTVQIAPKTISGANVNITVSPRGQNPPADAGAPPG